MKSTKIGFIGAGNMAGSLIRGLVAGGHDAGAVWATDIDAAKLTSLADECGISTGDMKTLIDAVDVVVLAVKPQVMSELCATLATLTGDRSPLVISIAAGITVEHLQRWLVQPTAIVRCMPNTPSLIGKGASGLFANSLVNDAQRQIAQEIMSSVGIAAWVETETAIDAVTAVSGSGPAYYFLFMEAMQEAAEELGLDADLARQLVEQTAAGAAALAIASDESVATLRRQVTSPGGTTEQAIMSFEAGGLKALVKTAMRAAHARSITLAEELGDK